MKSDSSFVSGFSGFFGGVEIAKKIMLSFGVYLSQPTGEATFASHITNASETTCVIAPKAGVGKLITSVCGSKVIKTIVSRITIFMIDFLVGRYNAKSEGRRARDGNRLWNSISLKRDVPIPFSVEMKFSHSTRDEPAIFSLGSEGPNAPKTGDFVQSFKPKDRSPRFGAKIIGSHTATPIAAWSEASAQRQTGQMPHYYTGASLWQ